VVPPGGMGPPRCQRPWVGAGSTIARTTFLFRDILSRLVSADALTYKELIAG
jgi:hypothetical protein